MTRSTFRFEKGNQSLATAIAAHLEGDATANVQLGHVVTAVSHDDSQIKIEGQAGQERFEINAAAVIIAVPVKLVPEIEFKPALPRDFTDAIATVPMGTAAKLAIGTRQPPPLRARQDVEMPYWSWTGKGGMVSLERP